MSPVLAARNAKHGTKSDSIIGPLALRPIPIDDPNLVTVPVMQEELLLVTAPSHALASRRRAGSSDLGRVVPIAAAPGS